MTSLEQALARILESIEDTKQTGNTHALNMLLRRKHAICAALAAPEQAWADPSEHADLVDTRAKTA